MKSKGIKLIFNIIIRIAPPVLLTVCAADLIYLYSDGFWYDPIELIEKLELVMFTTFVIFGVIGLIYQVRNIRRELATHRGE